MSSITSCHASRRGDAYFLPVTRSHQLGFDGPLIAEPDPTDGLGALDTLTDGGGLDARAVRRFLAGARFLVVRRFLAGARFLVVRRFLAGARLLVVRRFLAGARFLLVRRFLAGARFLVVRRFLAGLRRLAAPRLAGARLVALRRAVGLRAADLRVELFRVVRLAGMVFSSRAPEPNAANPATSDGSV